MADLVSLADLKVALGISDNDSDPKLTQAIENSSAAIRSYVDRPFETPVSASSTRSYAYDGSGVLEIDDAQSVTLVVQDGITLDPLEYSAEPYVKPYTWLFLPPYVIPESPAMGFTRNLDKFWWRAYQQPKVVQVTGTWGWPAIPKDVEQAAIYTAAAFAETPRPFVSERIGEVSRVYTPSALRDAIPPRAKELLEPYFRGR